MRASKISPSLIEATLPLMISIIQDVMNGPYQFRGNNPLPEKVTTPLGGNSNQDHEPACEADKVTLLHSKVISGGSFRAITRSYLIISTKPRKGEDPEYIAFLNSCRLRLLLHSVYRSKGSAFRGYQYFYPERQAARDSGFLPYYCNLHRDTSEANVWEMVKGRFHDSIFSRISAMFRVDDIDGLPACLIHEYDGQKYPLNVYIPTLEGRKLLEAMPEVGPQPSYVGYVTTREDYTNAIAMVRSLDSSDDIYKNGNFHESAVAYLLRTKPEMMLNCLDVANQEDGMHVKEGAKTPLFALTSVDNFTHSRVDQEPTSFVEARILYTTYQHFCLFRGMTPLDKTQFGIHLKRITGVSSSLKKIDGKVVRGYKGLSLK